MTDRGTVSKLNCMQEKFITDTEYVAKSPILCAYSTSPFCLSDISVTEEVGDEAFCSDNNKTFSENVGEKIISFDSKVMLEHSYSESNEALGKLNIDPRKKNVLNQKNVFKSKSLYPTEDLMLHKDKINILRKMSQIFNDEKPLLPPLDNASKASYVEHSKAQLHNINIDRIKERVAELNEKEHKENLPVSGDNSISNTLENINSNTTINNISEELDKSVLSSVVDSDILGYKENKNNSNNASSYISNDDGNCDCPINERILKEKRYQENINIVSQDEEHVAVASVPKEELNIAVSSVLKDKEHIFVASALKDSEHISVHSLPQDSEHITVCSVTKECEHNISSAPKDVKDVTIASGPKDSECMTIVSVPEVEERIIVASIPKDDERIVVKSSVGLAGEHIDIIDGFSFLSFSDEESMNEYCIKKCKKPFRRKRGRKCSLFAYKRRVNNQRKACVQKLSTTMTQISENNDSSRSSLDENACLSDSLTSSSSCDATLDNMTLKSLCEDVSNSFSERVVRTSESNDSCKTDNDVQNCAPNSDESSIYFSAYSKASSHISDKQPVELLYVYDNGRLLTLGGSLKNIDPANSETVRTRVIVPKGINSPKKVCYRNINVVEINENMAQFALSALKSPDSKKSDLLSAPEECSRLRGKHDKENSNMLSHSVLKTVNFDTCTNTASKGRTDTDFSRAESKSQSTNNTVISKPKIFKKNIQRFPSLSREMKRLSMNFVEHNFECEDHPSPKRVLEPCSNDFCKLGCICQSLQCERKEQLHCGRVECMLNCTCSGETWKHSLNSNGKKINMLSILHVDREQSENLANKERDFRKTVISTGTEVILVGGEKKRLRRLPDRYKDSVLINDELPLLEDYDEDDDDLFCVAGVPVKRKEFILKNFSLDIPWYDLKDMSIWCMDHSCYDCYCFQESKVTNNSKNLPKDCKQSDLVNSFNSQPQCVIFNVSFTNSLGSSTDFTIKRWCHDIFEHSARTCGYTNKKRVFNMCKSNKRHGESSINSLSDSISCDPQATKKQKVSDITLSENEGNDSKNCTNESTPKSVANVKKGSAQSSDCDIEIVNEEISVTKMKTISLLCLLHDEEKRGELEVDLTCNEPNKSMLILESRFRKLLNMNVIGVTSFSKKGRCIIGSVDSLEILHKVRTIHNSISNNIVDVGPNVKEIFSPSNSQTALQRYIFLRVNADRKWEIFGSVQKKGFSDRNKLLNRSPKSTMSSTSKTKVEVEKCAEVIDLACNSEEESNNHSLSDNSDNHSYNKMNTFSKNFDQINGGVLEYNKNKDLHFNANLNTHDHSYNGPNKAKGRFIPLCSVSKDNSCFKNYELNGKYKVLKYKSNEGSNDENFTDIMKKEDKLLFSKESEFYKSRFISLNFHLDNFKISVNKRNSSKDDKMCSASVQEFCSFIDLSLTFKNVKLNWLNNILQNCVTSEKKFKFGSREIFIYFVSNIEFNALYGLLKVYKINGMYIPFYIIGTSPSIVKEKSSCIKNMIDQSVYYYFLSEKNNELSIYKYFSISYLIKVASNINRKFQNVTVGQKCVAEYYREATILKKLPCISLLSEDIECDKESGKCLSHLNCKCMSNSKSLLEDKKTIRELGNKISKSCESYNTTSINDSGITNLTSEDNLFYNNSVQSASSSVSDLTYTSDEGRLSDDDIDIDSDGMLKDTICINNDKGVIEEHLYSAATEIKSEKRFGNRKSMHNALEQMRRREISDLFKVLHHASCYASAGHKNVKCKAKSKIEILSDACLSVKSLTDNSKELFIKKKNLKMQQENLISEFLKLVSALSESQQDEQYIWLKNLNKLY